jgi:hypothetical protein
MMTMNAPFSRLRPFSIAADNLRRTASLLAGLCVGLALAGCEGSVSVDLTAEPPADPNIAQVSAALRGLEFRLDSGTTKTLEFTSSTPTDFMDFVDFGGSNSTMRLFTNEQLPNGTYTGVRLLFDTDQNDDAFVADNTNKKFDLNLASGNFADLNFTIQDNERSSDSFTLTLDLRASLTFDDNTNDYTLTPQLRSVPTDDASRIEGTVTATCPTGDSLTEGAVYLFSGNDVTPDDIDGTGIEPFATTPLLTNQNGNQFLYALRFLPEGDYTIALTCRGNDEDSAVSDDLDFRNIKNVSLDRRKTQTVNIP